MKCIKRTMMALLLAGLLLMATAVPAFANDAPFCDSLRGAAGAAAGTPGGDLLDDAIDEYC